MAALTVVLALLAAVVGGAVALFTVGTVGAIVIVLLVLALAGYGLYAKGASLSAATGVAAVVLVGALGFGGYSGFQLYSALSSTDGSTDPADPAALASANAKLDAADGKAEFRVELTEEELTAVMQDTLASASDNPLRRVDVIVVDAEDGGQGSVEFIAAFKNGSLTGEGRVTAELDAGAIVLHVKDVSLGNLQLPGIATGAMEDLVETILDLNSRLEEMRADVQSLHVGDGRVLITGSQAGGEILTASTLLDALAESAASVGAAVTPPAEVIGAGTVNSTSQDGATYIVALGDSLAANVGVSAAREGYVARFHKAIVQRDGTEYGLRNFGVSGETSGTLIRGGQLDEASAFIRANDVAYVTIDIGANDLLGHLGSADCEQSISNAAC
ncbi:MAG: SGNH/GDSL hydrolase family protein [Chloroflexi bacterium]|nr:SGNH/GDSL hydrolase family protein [Chloroflexota bacterium]